MPDGVGPPNLRHASRPHRTVDLLAPAQAVVEPKIKAVLSLSTGHVLEPRRLISRLRHEDLIRVRNQVHGAMRAGTLRLVCSICHLPVYIVTEGSASFVSWATLRSNVWRTACSSTDERATGDISAGHAEHFATQCAPLARLYIQESAGAQGLDKS